MYLPTKPGHLCTVSRCIDLSIYNATEIGTANLSYSKTRAGYGKYALYIMRLRVQAGFALGASHSGGYIFISPPIGQGLEVGLA